MANTDKPYRRIGTNSWQELLDQVNDVLENPPAGCDALDPIETPEESHKWSKTDIQGVHDKLNEMPGDCFSFAEIPDKWKLSIITDIEDQLGDAWCECDDCFDECTNAQGVVITYLGSLITSDCLYCGVSGSDLCDTEVEELMAEAVAAGNRASVAKNNWVDTQVEYCHLKEEVEELEAELENLEESRDEICALPDNVPACQAAQAEVDEKQAEVDEKTIERDDKKTEVDDYLADADNEAIDSMDFAAQASGASLACGSYLAPSAGVEPCTNSGCDDLEPECWFQGQNPDRCCVGWSVQRKGTLLAPYHHEGGWQALGGGRYTPNGLPYVTSGTGALCIPDKACVVYGPTPCTGCSSTYQYEGRLIQVYPFPTGEQCC
jgi:hypothetical protein